MMKLGNGGMVRALLEDLVVVEADGKRERD